MGEAEEHRVAEQEGDETVHRFWRHGSDQLGGQGRSGHFSMLNIIPAGLQGISLYLYVTKVLYLKLLTWP